MLLAVTTAVPILTAVTSPDCDTLTILSSLDIHVIPL